jgi:hypothetical protein
MRDVRAKVENLYRAFAAVPRPRHIDGCPCCIDRKEVGVLLSKPLRSVTPEELSAYAASAFLTVGDAADYLYFLPRILEVTATEPSWWPDPEVTGRAIRAANPETWSAARLSALTGFLEAVVEAAVRDGDYFRLDSWVCAIGRAGLDVRPSLGLIGQSPAAVLGYFEVNAEGLPRGRLANAFWELPCPAHDAVVDWFFTPAVARVPFEAYGYVLTRDG